MSTGKLYIISAPSGAGKTSLVKRLIAETDNLSVSVSHTTRAIRPGETDGDDYFFVSVGVFQEMIEQGAFLEYAQVFDNYYGTARQSVESLLADGCDVILEIDWQGAQQVRGMIPACLSIFVLPPSIEILQARLKGRGQDSEQIIARRMRDAVAEMRHYDEFDYLLVNDDFDQALQALKSIVESNRLSATRQQCVLAPLITELLQDA